MPLGIFLYFLSSSFIVYLFLKGMEKGKDKAWEELSRALRTKDKGVLKSGLSLICLGLYLFGPLFFFLSLFKRK